MDANLDIRRITLIKRYRPDQVDETQFGWYVFGYYDRMNVEEICIDTSSHPLEKILDDAQTQSLSNSASIKQHVIYAIGAEQNTSHKSFWDSANKYPLLLVSLIHLKHPLSSAFMNDHIQSIKKSIQEKRKGNDIQFSVYFSIDCNDLIVFWSATSFQKTMELIAQVCDCNSSLIGELFTIQTCDNTIMSENGTNAKLSIWKQNEPVFQCIRIRVRSENFSDLLNRITDIPKDIEKRKKQQTGTIIKCYVKTYVVPGQDDVVLAFHYIPLDWLLDMYAPSGHNTSKNDSLCSLLYEGLLSRSVIDTELERGKNIRAQDQRRNTTSGSNADAKKDRPSGDSTSGSNVKLEIDNLTKCIQKANFKRTTWLPALYELLFELANLETSPTAYDIYVQAAPCHMVLVDELIKRIGNENGASELQKPNTTIVRNIQQYLQGWSQLSFHARLCQVNPHTMQA